VTRAEHQPARLVVLVSGTGSNLGALLTACADPAYGAAVVAVGADRPGIPALERAVAAGVPTFVRRVGDYPDRATWDADLRDEVLRHEPDLVVLAGFMKITGPDFLAALDARVINTHPALLPSFPGMYGPRDALAAGVRVSGATLFLVDEGVDTGPIIAQTAVPVLDDDDAETLHERIKVAERAMLVDTIGRMVREGWTVVAPNPADASPGTPVGVRRVIIGPDREDLT
jgi:phosphoribosylglycinamide formyltransferase-1